MERNYNFIYEKLVKSEDDLVGLIAYAIYKKHKIEFITRIKEEEGREPSQEECTAFFKASTTDSQLTKYINDATSILSDVVVNTTKEELERYEREMLADYEESIRKEIESFERSMLDKYKIGIKEALPSNKKNFWLSFLAGILSAFVFSLIAALFFILGETSEQATRNRAKQIIELITEQHTDSIQTNNEFSQ